MSKRRGCTISKWVEVDVDVELEFTDIIDNVDCFSKEELKELKKIIDAELGIVDLTSLNLESIYKMESFEKMNKLTSMQIEEMLNEYCKINNIKI